MSTIIYVSEVIYSKIHCENCGHEEGNRHLYPDEEYGDEWTCPKCGEVSKIDYEDFQDE